MVRLSAVSVGKAATIVALFAMMSFASCSTGPEPIRYGQDNCHSCKMTLTDKRFGAEIVTKKGKIFKFDDLNCLSNYLKSGEVPNENIGQIVSVDFKKTGSFVEVQKAYFLHNEAIKSPMRADIACFSDLKVLEVVKAEVAGGKMMNWEEVRASF